MPESEFGGAGDWKSLQSLCDEVRKQNEILVCLAYGKKGKLLGVSYGPTVSRRTAKTAISPVERVWSNFGRLSSEIDGVRRAVVSFRDFKILGFPIEGSDAELVAVVEASLDELRVEEKVKDCIRRWMDRDPLRALACDLESWITT